MLKKDELVQVTPEMVKAGLDEWRNAMRSGHADDKPYLVESIYMAMEYQRRERNS